MKDKFKIAGSLTRESVEQLYSVLPKPGPGWWYLELITGSGPESETAYHGGQWGSGKFTKFDELPENLAKCSIMVDHNMVGFGTWYDVQLSQAGPDTIDVSLDAVTVFRSGTYKRNLRQIIEDSFSQPSSRF